MIQKNFGYVKMCSRLVKIAAWTFLLFGVIQGIGVLAGAGQNIPRLLGIFYIIVYVAGFFLVYLISFIADILLELWQFLKKERF